MPRRRSCGLIAPRRPRVLVRRLCVAMPIYYASGSKFKAFGWSLLSGITEPLGGIVGFAVLQPVFSKMVFGIVFAAVGGSESHADEL